MSMREELLQKMVAAADIAGRVVEALRSRHVSGSMASLALMFAAARVCRLRGITKEHFTSVSALMWELAADDSEASATNRRANR